jgi:hypothetical protein
MVGMDTRSRKITDPVQIVAARRWLGLLLVLLLASCGRGGKDLPDVAVELIIEPSPPQIGPAVITATLRDAEGQPLAGSTVELEATMSHAGMVPVFAQAMEVAPGRYEASLEFTMGGDWFILVHANLPDGRAMERKIDVPGVDALSGDTPAP